MLPLIKRAYETLVKIEFEGEFGCPECFNTSYKGKPPNECSTWLGAEVHAPNCDLKETMELLRLHLMLVEEE